MIHMSCSVYRMSDGSLLTVLVPTMYVGCSLRWSGTMDGKRFQYPRCTWVVVIMACNNVLYVTMVLVPAMHVGCSIPGKVLMVKAGVLVPTMHVGCIKDAEYSQERRIEFQYPRCTWVVVKSLTVMISFTMFQYPRCTWVVVINQYILFRIVLFQYSRCTWVVVAKSAQKQFLYALILSQCAAFVKCFFQ